ncbi:hypothetical protein ZWY2020_023937 [Hordeum vulgare]|nr:hypothetical protein ZWY2020_023937 [Hordeum vulgare]
MPGLVPESWPDLIGTELQAAVQTIHEERPDIRIARVLLLQQQPSHRHKIKNVSFTTTPGVPNTWVVVAPAPYIG